MFSSSSLQDSLPPLQNGLPRRTPPKENGDSNGHAKKEPVSPRSGHSSASSTPAPTTGQKKSGEGSNHVRLKESCFGESNTLFYVVFRRGEADNTEASHPERCRTRRAAPASKAWRSHSGSSAAVWDPARVPAAAGSAAGSCCGRGRRRRIRGRERVPAPPWAA